MKNSFRLISAILAAMLCAAAFSACASEVKPPVTDVTTNAQFTTDAPLTITPITDTHTITTDVPAVVTETPISTESQITTETFSAEVPITTIIESNIPEDEILNELLYLADNGNVMIKNVDDVAFPTEGISFFQLNDRSKDTRLCLFVEKVHIVSKTEAELVLKNGEAYIKYGNCTVFDLPTAYTTADGTVCGITEYKATELSFERSVVIMRLNTKPNEYLYLAYTIFDKGTSFNCCVGNFYDISYYNDNVGYAISMAHSSMHGLINIYKTDNGGESFELLGENSALLSSAVYGNIIALSENVLLHCGNGITPIAAFEIEDTVVKVLYKGSNGKSSSPDILPIPDFFGNMMSVKSSVIYSKNGIIIIESYGSYENGRGEDFTYYIYHISFDNGTSWHLYSDQLF